MKLCRRPRPKQVMRLIRRGGTVFRVGRRASIALASDEILDLRMTVLHDERRR